MYHIVLEIASPFSLSPQNKFSTCAAMLELVIDQPRKRRPFPPVPLRLLLTSEPAQPDQVLPAGPQLQQLEFESLMFDAAQHTAPQVVHGAPVENSQGHLIAEATKGKQYFRFVFAIHYLAGLLPYSVPTFPLCSPSLPNMSGSCA